MYEREIGKLNIILPISHLLLLFFLQRGAQNFIQETPLDNNNINWLTTTVRKVENNPYFRTETFHHFNGRIFSEFALVHLVCTPVN